MTPASANPASSSFSPPASESAAPALQRPSAVVLDIDQSSGTLPGALHLPLSGWHEALRFGCTLSTLRRFEAALRPQLPAQYGPVLLGSGDFHHLSWPLITHCLNHLAEHTPPSSPNAGGKPSAHAASGVRVVVLDNHPDNMRFPWGVHCGSWVRRVALHPAVAQVHVVGITSGDIGPRHAWENYLTPLRQGRLHYWSCGVDTRWARHIGASAAFHSHSDAASLVQAFLAWLHAQPPQPTYLSIDKDVFHPSVVRTNWDQGQLQQAQAQAIIAALRGQLIGSDITGDVSAWHYRTWWKRLLSAGDGQDIALPPTTVAEWQTAQHALNRQLVHDLNQAYRPPFPPTADTKERQHHA